MSGAKHVSEGYHSITPYLVVKGAASAIAFYKEAFGATELMRLVEDVDALASQAIAAGATVIFPVENASEDRRGGLMDPFGHIWWIATRIEDISRQEIQRRFEANVKQTER